MGSDRKEDPFVTAHWSSSVAHTKRYRVINGMPESNCYILKTFNP